MTSEAQPGQEQRMVTDAMINAGGTAVVKSAHLTGCERAKLIYAAMEAARPTADLGEDGELLERLRRSETGPNGEPINIDGPEAADRLILYREALRRARRIIATETLLPDELAAIDAVLSRSGH